MDSLSSLSVGNGEFAYTVDATGLQTFPEVYKNGVPLGTQSQWGWHSFANTGNYKPEDAQKEYDFGRGHKEVYACQFKEEGRQKDASNWLRVNPHRLHLGIVGLELERVGYARPGEGYPSDAGYVGRRNHQQLFAGRNPLTGYRPFAILNAT